MTKRQQELFSGLPSKQKYVSDYPDLFAEWHPTKNGRKVPEDFTHGSNKKVWWKCTKGHEWNASIVNRSKGRGCPYCANKLVCSDNDLEVLYPEVAKYWSVKNKVHSSEVLPKSGKRYIWECLNGHSWEDTPHNLVNNHNCAGFYGWFWAGSQQLHRAHQGLVIASPRQTPCPRAVHQMKRL